MPTGATAAVMLKRSIPRPRTPGQQRTLECLRDKVIVFLGDSVMRELFTEWALWLGISVPGFNARWLRNDFKKQVSEAAEPTTRHSIGPLDVFFKLYNQDVSLTDHRLNLTIKFRQATHFNWSNSSSARLRFWQSTAFRQELEELGVHPVAHPRGVDAVFASTTFHDDAHLVTACTSKGCQCNISWSEKLARYASDAAAVASNLTTLQRAGVQVVWFSLFARDKNTHGGPDVVRGVVDHAVHTQLRASGFFDAGGRLVDQWPLYASYFGLVRSRHAAAFSTSSVHYSASSHGDRFVLPDLGAMRVQLALDALCSDSAWEPPCGLERDYMEQTQLVATFQPDCQCAGFALSIGSAFFCRKSNDILKQGVQLTYSKQGVQLRWQHARVETLALQAQLEKEFKGLPKPASF